MHKIKLVEGVDYESIIDRAENGESIILLDKEGTPIAVILPFEDWEAMKEKEDE